MAQFGPRRELGIRKGIYQQTQGIGNRRRTRNAIQFVNGDRRAAASFALDVDFLQDGLDRFVIGRAGPGGQPGRIGGILGELGLGHGVFQKSHGGGRGDVLEDVDRCRGRIFWSWRFVDLFDQRRNLLVILGRSPSHNLSVLRAQCKAGVGYDLRQETQGIVGTARSAALDLVDYGGGRRSAGVFGVNFGEDGLDRLVIRRDSQPGQTLWIVGIRCERGFGNHIFQHGRGIGCRNELQRVDRDFRRFFRRRSSIQLAEQSLDLQMIFSRGPSDHLAQFGPGGESGLGKSLRQHSICVGHRG